MQRKLISAFKTSAQVSLSLVLFVLLAICIVSAQEPAPNAEAQSIISFLNQTVVWYHQLTLQQQLATEPSDILFLNDNRQIADDVVRLSFEFARARAQVLAAQGQGTTSASESSAAAPNRLQSLISLANKSDQQVKELQGEIENIRQQLETAKGRKRTSLEAALAETQSELQLAITRRDTIRSILSFAAVNGAGGALSLQSQIDELARTVPVATTTAEKNGSGANENSQAPKVQVTNVPARAGTSTGIIDLVTQLLALHRKSDTLEQAAAQTDQLAQAVRTVRAPLIPQMRQLAAQADQLATQPDATDPKVLATQKKQVDAINAQFKQLSAALLPLSKESILLDIYKRNVENWRSSVQSEYRTELKSFILRLVILGIVLGLVVTMSQVWKKATFRYVHDARRRYQFLLLRRIVTWFVAAIVIAAAFATELGTLATFAGLLTAGVAVALQNVILSVAGYFFLIGKYGVRVGDRVQIAGVTGDVIDIGLVRLHIMEVGAEGTDARATGRVVVFSNAVVFQPNAGLFKQIPGTNFVWHQISLTLAADSNYHLVEKRIMEAVNSVYAKYKDAMEIQRRRMEQNLTGVSIRPLDPETRLRLTQGGLEVVIRYPVELSNAAQIDDEMARALLDAISKEPRLKLVGTGTPNIQPVTDGTAV
ncbi:MAG: mechanosensitive ion channel domain-containing protein [Terriglobales bacterium]